MRHLNDAQQDFKKTIKLLITTELISFDVGFLFLCFAIIKIWNILYSIYFLSSLIND